MPFVSLLMPPARVGFAAGSLALCLALSCSSNEPSDPAEQGSSGKSGGSAGQAGSGTSGGAGVGQGGSSGAAAGGAGTGPRAGASGAAGSGVAGSGTTGGAAGAANTGGAAGTGALSGAGGDVNAAGGTAGSNAGGGGGSDTAGAAGSSAGTGSGPCGASGLLLCDDFEDTAVGMLPEGAPWAASNCSDTQRTLKVDGTESKSGMNSLVSGKIGYDDCSLHADIGTPEDFYVRSWVQFGAGADFSMHEVTVFELGPSAGTDDPEIRVGFRGDSSCNPTGAEVTITGGGEVTGCSGFQFEADTWYCVEAHVTQGGSGATVELWIDDAAQSFTVHSMPVDSLEWPSWTTPARYLKVGVRSYSGQPEWLVYNDDVAVGSQRIGCN